MNERQGNTYLNQQEDESKHIRRGNYRISAPEGDLSMSNDFYKNEDTQTFDKRELQLEIERQRYIQERPIELPKRGNYRLDTNRLEARMQQNAYPQKAHNKPSKKLRKSLTPSRVPKAKGQLPKGKASLFVMVVILFISMASAAWYVGPFSKANQIIVKGNEWLSTDEIVFQAGIRPYQSRKSIQKTSKEILENLQHNNLMIDEASLNFADWKKVEIIIKENKIVGRIPQSDTPLYLLSNGTTVEIQGQGAPEMVPDIQGAVDQNKLLVLGQTLEELDGDLLKKIEWIETSEEDARKNTLVAKMQDGNYIKAVPTSFAQKMLYYPEIIKLLGNKKGTLDMQVGVYFTPDLPTGEAIKLDNQLETLDSQ